MIDTESPEELCLRVVELPERSEWYCQLFGMGEGLVFHPGENAIPNRFWRVMQYLFFGNKWIKEEK